MIKDVKTLIAAKRLVHEDDKLMESLKGWHSNKGRVAQECADYNFEEWLSYMLEEMSGKIGVNYPDYPTIEQIVGSLRVNSIGDFIAIRASKIAEGCGFESDIDCYVEDGVVYSSVWLKSDDAKKTEEYADNLTEKFNNIGYSAETYIDEEDNREATVNACLDFPLYMKLVDSGMNAECLLCGCGHRKWYNIFPQKKGSDMASIEEKIWEIIKDNFEVPPERMSRDSSLREDLGADELDVIEIIIEIEGTFGISITEDDSEKLDTVGKMIDYVDAAVKKQNAS